MSGYLSAEYAASLAEFGTPRLLPRSAGWLLERDIPSGEARDAMGLYPRFCCRDVTQVSADLDTLAAEPSPPVSVALVTDPFADWNDALLQACFPDRVLAFKSHFVVDLVQPLAEFITSHHRYYTRVALRSVRVEQVETPEALLDDWDRLYGHLAERHKLVGIKRFSRRAFAAQLAAPGLIAFRAVDGAGCVVGAQLWYVESDRAYNHLAAFSPEGYAAQASYALYDASLHYFQGRARWLDLGAGAGLDPAADDGLSRFKRGWSNATRPVYFCGRVLDRQRYDELVRRLHPEPTPYFPAYRAGEFA